METTDVSVKDEIVQALNGLSLEELQAVLQFTRRMVSKTPPGTPGEVLIARAESLDFDPDELAQMLQAIEEECERIDWDGWNTRIFD